MLLNRILFLLLTQLYQFMSQQFRRVIIFTYFFCAIAPSESIGAKTKTQRISSQTQIKFRRNSQVILKTIASGKISDQKKILQNPRSIKLPHVAAMARLAQW